MNVILLPIKPRYVDKIFEGIKRFEFRRVCCKKEPDKIIIYSTAPIKKVVGEVEIIETLQDKPNEIWSITSGYAGISRGEFDMYFKDKNIATAYRLGKTQRYMPAKSLVDYGIYHAPQSFIYLLAEEVQGE